MKKILLVLIALAGFALSSFAQTDIKVKGKYGGDTADLDGYLHFEDIKLEKLSFTGSDLKNKNYQVFIRKFVNGNLAQTDMVFDSTEVSYFKVAGDELKLRVFAKRYENDTVRFEFQFQNGPSGSSITKEYKVTKNQKAFALKDFLHDSRGNVLEPSISLNASNYILAFMMPYVKKDGGTAYCEVAQSGVNPEELGRKYSIPLYFLIDVKFL